MSRAVRFRRGFTAEEVRAVPATKGRFDRWQMLCCRVRYFSDGAALRTRNFVNEIFAAQPVDAMTSEETRLVRGGGPTNQLPTVFPFVATGNRCFTSRQKWR